MSAAPALGTAPGNQPGTEDLAAVVIQAVTFDLVEPAFVLVVEAYQVVVVIQVDSCQAEVAYQAGPSVQVEEAS